MDRNSNIAEKVLTSMYVALRKESVDRNKNNRLTVGSSAAGRSPQGERG